MKQPFCWSSGTCSTCERFFVHVLLVFFNSCCIESKRLRRYVFAVLVRLGRFAFLVVRSLSRKMQAGEPRNMSSHSVFTPFHTFSHLFTPFPPSSIIEERSKIIKHYQTSSNLQNFSCLSHLEARSARPARPDTKLISFKADVISGFFNQGWTRCMLHGTWKFASHWIYHRCLRDVWGSFCRGLWLAFAWHS